MSTHKSSTTKAHHNMWSWITLSFVIVLADQASKYWFDHALMYGERLNITPFFDFTLLYNTGAAFSFMANGHTWARWVLISIAFLAILIIGFLIRKPNQSRLLYASLSLILGGAIGNVIDRLTHGHVIDFLLFYWNEWFFPAFNVADIAISCGAVLLIVDEIVRIRKSRKPANRL